MSTMARNYDTLSDSDKANLIDGYYFDKEENKNGQNFKHKSKCLLLFKI